MQGWGRYETMRETDRQIGREGKREDRKRGRQVYIVECSEGGSPLTSWILNTEISGFDTSVYYNR